MNEPKPIEISSDAEGRPLSVNRRGQKLRVLGIQNEWRIDDEWWREPLARRYYLLHLAGGRLLSVFQDLNSGAWYEQRA
ncbi:MAG: hypothetical protein ACR2PL_12770 [Dehalococcoidia bacterium]